MVNHNAGLKVPVADHGGELLWVHEAAAMDKVPGDLTCVGCAQPLTWRNGECNRPHFAHRGSGGGGGETALHKMAIEVLSRSIAAAATKGDPYPIDLPCTRCRVTRTGNLTKHRDLTIEHDRVLADGIRPDILIRSGDGAPRFVIEVIVSHAPEPGAKALYRRMGLPLISVWPGWETLEVLRDGLRAAHSAAYARAPLADSGALYDVDGHRCRSPHHFDSDATPTCPTCRTAATRRVAVEIAASKCYRCGTPTAILDLVENAPLQLRRIAASCPDLIGVERIASRHGIELRDGYSATAGGTYLAHHCRNGHLQGDNFIYDTEGALDRRRPVQHMTVCENGHWVDDGPPRPWPPDVVAERVDRVVGIVGEPAGVFGRRSTSVRSARSSDLADIGRFMAFGSRRRW